MFLLSCNVLIQSRNSMLKDTQMMLSSHYNTDFAWSNIIVFVLSSITCECNPKIPKLFHLLQWYSTNLQRTLDRISQKMEYLNLGSVDFHFSNVTCSCSPDSESSKIKSSEQPTNLESSKLNILISLVELLYTVHVNYEKKSEKTHPCWTPTHTWNDFDCLLFTLTSSW